ncbi:MAG: hypothetical protein V3S48_04695 [Candidatus Neomarinimicrobiota bacterium]
MKINFFKIKSRKLVLFSFLILINPAFGESGKIYDYEIDLTSIVNDRFQVIFNCKDFSANRLIYQFPKIIPGTYKKADYGKYIKNFSAFDHQGKKLSVKKNGKNTFIISNAVNIDKITYWVNDTWDAKWKRDKVYPMAGTNIDAGRNFVINAGGVFGYFENEELNPVKLKINKPEDLYGITVLDQEIVDAGHVIYTARDYHELVDSPVMFSEPDTFGFNVKNARVLIGVARENGEEKYAERLYEHFGPAMEAVGEYLGSLPVDNYTFIFYFPDRSDLAKIIEAKRFQGIRFIGNLLKNGLPMAGALEHNTSSFFYMIDLNEKYTDDIFKVTTEAGLHEFMHIITPLTLHSQHVGDFDYARPKMSQHLWLYEGLTEYFAHLILVQGGIITPQEFLFRNMRNKIRRGEKFPNEKMSFTEMSKNALKGKHKRQFIQVYQRGAVMGMLLDIEIIRLTKGEKTLIDVITELSQRYGKDKSFDEDTFIDEFVDLVHPDLKIFFDKYIDGREELPYVETFKTVGLTFELKAETEYPKHYIRDNGVKRNKFGLGGPYKIKKVKKKKDWVGFQKGDYVDSKLYWKLFYDKNGDYIPEGTMVDFPVKRQGEDIILPVKVEYKKGEVTNRFRIDPEPTETQKKYFDLWLGIK